MAYASNLTSAKLTDCYTLNDASLMGLCDCCPKLKTLDLSFCLVPSPVVSESGLALALPTLVHLVSLNVAYLEHVTDVVVAAVAKACPLLCNLNLEHCVEVTDKSLVEIARHLSNSLRVLNLQSDDLCTDVGVIEVLKKCQKLTNLDAANLHFLTDDTVAAVIVHAKVLEKLALQGCRKISKMARARVQEVWDEEGAARVR